MEHLSGFQFLRKLVRDEYVFPIRRGASELQPVVVGYADVAGGEYLWGLVIAHLPPRLRVGFVTHSLAVHWTPCAEFIGLRRPVVQPVRFLERVNVWQDRRPQLGFLRPGVGALVDRLGLQPDVRGRDGMDLREVREQHDGEQLQLHLVKGWVTRLVVRHKRARTVHNHYVDDPPHPRIVPVLVAAWPTILSQRHLELGELGTSCIAERVAYGS